MKEKKYCPYCGSLLAECECPGDYQGNLPETYAEVEYDDFESAEAIDGARWDDRNYQHYMER